MGLHIVKPMLQFATWRTSTKVDKIKSSSFSLSHRDLSPFSPNIGLLGLTCSVCFFLCWSVPSTFMALAFTCLAFPDLLQFPQAPLKSHCSVECLGFLFTEPCCFGFATLIPNKGFDAVFRNIHILHEDLVYIYFCYQSVLLYFIFGGWGDSLVRKESLVSAWGSEFRSPACT